MLLAEASQDKATLFKSELLILTSDNVPLEALELLLSV